MRLNYQEPSLKASLSYVLGTAATRALLAEARLTPKPALVDQRGSGAHDDLSLVLMERSAYALHSYFIQIVETTEQYGSVCGALREQIGILGREAEKTMFMATAGVNTHKGAIWSMGLVLTATTLLMRKERTYFAEDVCLLAGEIAKINDSHASLSIVSNGRKVTEKYQIKGAKEQAQEGFPVIREQGLPFFRNGHEAGLSSNALKVGTLLAMMTKLEDTCVVHRSGLSGLELVQQGARFVLAQGGLSTNQGLQAFKNYEQQLLKIRASSGGAADLLAVILFFDEIGIAHLS